MSTDALKLSVSVVDLASGILKSIQRTIASLGTRFVAMARMATVAMTAMVRGVQRLNGELAQTKALMARLVTTSAAWARAGRVAFNEVNTAARGANAEIRGTRTGLARIVTGSHAAARAGRVAFSELGRAAKLAKADVTALAKAGGAVRPRGASGGGGTRLTQEQRDQRDAEREAARAERNTKRTMETNARRLMAYNRREAARAATIAHQTQLNALRAQGRASGGGSAVKADAATPNPLAAVGGVLRGAGRLAVNIGLTVARAFAGMVTGLVRFAFHLGWGILGGALRGLGRLAWSAGAAVVRGFAAMTVGLLRFGVNTGWRLLTGAMHGVIGLAGRMGQALQHAALLGGTALAGLTGYALKLASEREAVLMGLGNLLGGSGRAKAQVEELRQIAKLPGINLENAISGFNGLTAVKVPLATTKALIKEIGNAVALAGGGANELHWAMRGISQMFGKGKVMAEELNQQVLEQAPVVHWAIDAAFKGMSVEAITKSGIKPLAFVEKILPFLERLPRAGNGAKNALENLKDAWKELLIAFGTGFMTGGVGKGLDSLAKRLENLRPAAERWGKVLRRVFDAVGRGVGLLAAQIQAVARGDAAQGWLQRLAGGAMTLIRRLPEIAGKAKALGAMLLEVGRGAVALVLRGFSFVWKLAQRVWPGVQGLIVNTAKELSGIDWQGSGQGLIGIIGAIADYLPGLPGLVAAVVVAVKGLFTTVGTDGVTAWQSFVGAVETGADTMLAAMKKIANGMGAVLDKAQQLRAWWNGEPLPGATQGAPANGNAPRQAATAGGGRKQQDNGRQVTPGSKTTAYVVGGAGAAYTTVKTGAALKALGVAPTKAAPVAGGLFMGGAAISAAAIAAINKVGAMQGIGRVKADLELQRLPAATPEELQKLAPASAMGVVYDIDAARQVARKHTLRFWAAYGARMAAEGNTEAVKVAERITAQIRAGKPGRFERGGIAEGQAKAGNRAALGGKVALASTGGSGNGIKLTDVSSPAEAPKAPPRWGDGPRNFSASLPDKANLTARLTGGVGQAGQALTRYAQASRDAERPRWMTDLSDLLKRLTDILAAPPSAAQQKQGEALVQGLRDLFAVPQEQARPAANPYRYRMAPVPGRGGTDGGWFGGQFRGGPAVAVGGMDWRPGETAERAAALYRRNLGGPAVPAPPTLRAPRSAPANYFNEDVAARQPIVGRVELSFDEAQLKRVLDPTAQREIAGTMLRARARAGA